MKLELKKWAYSFSERFAGMVENGGKRTTIRAIRKDFRCPRPLQWLRLWTGLRTPNARLLRNVVCVRIQLIKIQSDGWIAMGPDVRDGNVSGEYLAEGWTYLHYQEAEKLAKGDGFETSKDFMEFFLPDGRESPNFLGTLCTWRDLTPWEQEEINGKESTR